MARIGQTGPGAGSGGGPTAATAETVLIKLGGSLITDKTTPATPRVEVIERLAREIVDGGRELAGALVVGHGAGSFGHAAAERFGIHRGVESSEQLAGVVRTQEETMRLHRRVVEALRQAGALAFSFAPSSLMVSASGRPRGLGVEPLLLGLRLGLLPVIFGDVVMDREQGASICSTEVVFLALVRALRRRGWPVRRVLWMGETEGIYDRRGRTIPRIAPGAARRAFAAVGRSGGIDVTGGMRHRLEVVLALARLGVGSWLLNGQVPGTLARALAGEEVSGTRVIAAAGTAAVRQRP